MKQKRPPQQLLRLLCNSKRRRLPTLLFESQQDINIDQPVIRRQPDISDQHVLIIDTGGGVQPTVTKSAWKITHRYNHTVSITGYQSAGPPVKCPVVNAITRAIIPGRYEPVIFQVNHATLIQDETELESLVVPFDMMKHGVQVDMTPVKYGGSEAIIVDGEAFKYRFDDEKLFWIISKPSQDEIDTLRWIELNQPVLLGDKIRRKKHETLPSDIEWGEWQKRLAMLPEDVVKRTVLDATTQLYMHVENKHRGEPREHYQSRCPGLRNFRQNETVASDTYFPTTITNQGHTCSQLFVGLDSDFWVTYLLKQESSNGEALQDYTRAHGCPNIIKTDNAQSELGRTWTKHCRAHVIANETTEPHHPWQNPSEKNELVT